MRTWLLWQDFAGVNRSQNTVGCHIGKIQLIQVFNVYGHDTFYEVLIDNYRVYYSYETFQVSTAFFDSHAW